MTLALLLTAVTGAWADYTVTWEGTTLQGIAVRSNTATTSQTVEGITVTASKGDFFYNTTYPKGPVVIASSYADNGLVFSAENNIKSIAITFTESAYYGGEMAFEAGAHTYQVSPAAKSFALSKNDSFIGITKVVFTLEGDAPIELTPDTDKKVWTLDKMPASNIELQVEYEPTKVTMAANDKTMGTVEVSGESKVEWTADTWKGWKSDTKTYTVDDITMTSTQSAYINEYTNEDKYLHSLFFYVNQTDDNSYVTFSTTGDPFSRIEFTMIDDYDDDEWVSNKGVWVGNPVIMPKDNWTFEGKSAVWEGEATKSLTLQSCTTWVSKITFFKGAVPDGVTVNGDGTFTVAKTATVTLTATPKEGYKFLYWADDQTNTNPVREVTIESGMADMTYKAVFAEILYNVTFVEGTNLDEWSATPNPAKTKQNVTVTYNGAKKVIGVKAEKKSTAPASTLLDNTTTAWTAGTFAVPAGGLTYSDAITVSGDVTLVLTDGETLTLNKGISLASGATLTVEGNGTMNVNGTNNNTSSTVAGTGTLVLTSGTLNAKGGNGQGVGNRAFDTDVRANAGGNAINGNVTVSGGTLTATGGNGGGVGDRSLGSYGAAGGVAISGSVTVTGGAVTATGGNGGSIGAFGANEYGGNGGAAIGGDATISGGTWTATDGTHGVNGDGQGGDGGKAVAGTVTDNR